MNPDGVPFPVFREMKSDGGWTVFQRWMDGSKNFHRSWPGYGNGLGNLEKKFWLALEKIHHLTKKRFLKLRIDILDFDGSSWRAAYAKFGIDRKPPYKLTVRGFSGNIRDSFSYANARGFAVFGTLGLDIRGGWWIKNELGSRDCFLNGLYGKIRITAGTQYMTWVRNNDWTDPMNFSFIKFFEMKLKL